MAGALGARAAGFGELLERVGYRLDDGVAISHKPPRGTFGLAGYVSASQAAELAAAHAADDVWFGVNAMASRPASGRGTAKDVTRLAALHADLDVGLDKLPSFAVGWQVIADVSEVLGTRPSVVILSGHGLQPLWPVDPDDPAAHLDTPEKRENAGALLKLFGRLVGRAAHLHGGKVDGVFDLARVLRVPGTVNRKVPGAPVPTGLQLDTGYPLTFNEIAERLTEYGIKEQPGDRDSRPDGERVAPAAEWWRAEATHPAVTRAVESWQGQTPSARHPWLLGCCTSLAFARRLGWVTEADHRRAVGVLERRFRWLVANTGTRREVEPGEVAGCLAHGVAVAERNTDDIARADWAFWVQQVGTSTTGTDGFTVDVVTGKVLDEDEAFWTSRETLTYIRDLARARMVSPYALLGAVLARRVATIPPHVVLPPVVGTKASLNIFVAQVGLSGSGKGVALGLSAEAFPGSDLASVPQVGAGSGEGIGHLFAHREGKNKELVRHETRVLLTVEEIGTLGAVGGRQGATLMPELRKAWSGEPLGCAYATPEKNLPIGRHTYRLCFVAGVQPALGGVLLDDLHGGTPQRFLWLPATDPHMQPDASCKGWTSSPASGCSMTPNVKPSRGSRRRPSAPRWALPFEVKRLMGNAGIRPRGVTPEFLSGAGPWRRCLAVRSTEFGTGGDTHVEATRRARRRRTCPLERGSRCARSRPHTTGDAGAGVSSTRQVRHARARRSVR